MLANPVTGEVVPEDDEHAQRMAVQDADRLISAHFREIAKLEEGRNLILAELPVPTVPRPRNRTSKQGALTKCPNCGARVA